MNRRPYLFALLGILSLSSAALGGEPVIDRFEGASDCILPDPRAHILSYSASGGVGHVRIDALHRGGRVRTFHTASSGGRLAPSMGAIGVQDPGAAADVEAYLLVVTGEGGAEVSRVMPFRYRRAVFDLVPPTLHNRITSGTGHVALYQSAASITNVDSLSCSFQFDAPIGGETGKSGTAEIVRASVGPRARCFVRWSSVRKANAGGTVEWTARVTDQCTQGRITRSARVNPIH